MSNPLIPLLEPIRADLERVECVLRGRLAAAGEPLGRALGAALTGGKRLRPALVILAGRLLEAPAPPFIALGAAMDILHAATLVHDDLVDQALVRRGRPALHTVWPLRAAVLGGDYLLAEAIALVAELGEPRILGATATLLRTMCAGEIRQALSAAGDRVRREEYYRSIEAKTASLFARSLEMAGALAGAGEAQTAALGRYGRELGIAYQIVDDVLDLTGDERELGKLPAGDLRQGLVTLPVLCYLERVPGEAAVQAVLAGERDETHLRAAVEAIRASGAAEMAVAEARGHAALAQEALVALPGNPARELLARLADYIVARRS